MSTAVVVDSGPNGLACAVALAREGLEVTMIEAEATIGGGTRSSELTVPGVLHDHCSAVHPMAVASPFMQSLDLERHGLRWLRAEIDLAHPLDGGEAADWGDEGVCASGPVTTPIGEETICVWRTGPVVMALGGSMDLEQFEDIAAGMDGRAASGG